MFLDIQEESRYWLYIWQADESRRWLSRGSPHLHNLIIHEQRKINGLANRITKWFAFLVLLSNIWIQHSVYWLHKVCVKSTGNIALAYHFNISWRDLIRHFLPFLFYLYVHTLRSKTKILLLLLQYFPEKSIIEQSVQSITPIFYLNGLLKISGLII